MVNHYIHQDQSQNNIIKANGSNTIFYVLTKDGGGGGGGGGDGTPGPVSYFQYLDSWNGGESYPNTKSCTVGVELNFSWGAPADDGGSAVTGYAIRRIYTDLIPNTAYPSGDPSVVQTVFLDPCLAGADVIGPVILGNVNTYTLSDVSCGWYSYQIAALNANGTGIFYPTGTLLAVPDVGYQLVPSDNGYGITNLGEGTIRLNYSTGAESCGNGYTWSSVSGDLYAWGNWGTIIDTTVEVDEINAGELYFSGQSVGIYWAEIFETWVDEEGVACVIRKNSCLQIPFEITG